MIILITGASHTGKTVLAQRLLERYQIPYVSIDHLKMGLIRSGQTTLTPEDDEELVLYLWPIVREIIKTAIENHQHLILEGCYIPVDWKKDFEEEYLKEITYICLIMTEQYIREHFSDIQIYASEIEQRLDDSECTMEWLLRENLYKLEMSKKYSLPYHLIDKDYNTDINCLLQHSFSECF
ncbi:MAG: adenylate kinase [Lachnospiraceae bacterium]|nr:adenylate kinase [Lachnospiraceae bacterium]